MPDMTPNELWSDNCCSPSATLLITVVLPQPSIFKNPSDNKGVEGWKDKTLLVQHD